MTYEQIIDSLKSEVTYGHTATQLAERIGISRSYLSEVFSGRKKLSSEILERMGYEITYKKAKTMANRETNTKQFNQRYCRKDYRNRKD